MDTQNKKNFFKQIVSVEKSTRNLDRITFLKNEVQDKKVLHVGFVDYPITDKNKNLHIQLASYCTTLDGIDPNISDETLQILTVSNGKIFKTWDDISDDYDIILVPEVIEHVDNVKDFLEKFNKFSGRLIVTAPCVFYHRDKSFREYDDYIVEIVHPDHNCWYSPFTLKNTLEKYTNRKVESIHMLAGSVAVICK